MPEAGRWTSWTKGLIWCGESDFTIDFLQGLLSGGSRWCVFVQAGDIRASWSEIIAHAEGRSLLNPSFLSLTTKIKNSLCRDALCFITDQRFGGKMEQNPHGCVLYYPCLKRGVGGVAPCNSICHNPLLPSPCPATAPPREGCFYLSDARKQRSQCSLAPEHQPAHRLSR